MAGDGFYYAPILPARWLATSAATSPKTPAVCCLVRRDEQRSLHGGCSARWQRRRGFGDGRDPELDLRGVFIGSEGTLGIATAITLRLLRQPACVAVLLADFASMEAAGEAVRRVAAAGVRPGMEIMDRRCIHAVNDFFGVDEYPREAAAVLLVELDGPLSRGVGAVGRSLPGSRGGWRSRGLEPGGRVGWKGRKYDLSPGPSIPQLLPPGRVVRARPCPGLGRH